MRRLINIVEEQHFADSREVEILQERESKLETLSPDQLARLRQQEEEAREWHKNNPPSHQNIINHYKQATDDERHVGLNWYTDAHDMAKAIARDTDTPVHTVAGVISNYSPQSHWANNLHVASRVLKSKRALGGLGSGVFADERQKAAAQRMLDGEHYNDVLAGQKTRAFAHLIEFGKSESGKPVVVIDRHAFSVAAGGRMSDAAFTQAGLKSKKIYSHISNLYDLAAKELSELYGVPIDPHQVQATTWLVRQRLNSEHERERQKGNSKTKKMADIAKAKWDIYAGEHHPSIVGREPGTGY